MAKQKNFNASEFDNIVDESFAEGYTSEPERPSASGRGAGAAPAQGRPAGAEAPPTESTSRRSGGPALSENERRLRKLIAGDEEELGVLYGSEGRYTCYLSELLQACIDIYAYREGYPKTKVVGILLNQFFPEDLKAEARERIVELAIKDLERKVKDERK